MFAVFDRTRKQLFLMETQGLPLSVTSKKTHTHTQKQKAIFVLTLKMLLKIISGHTVLTEVLKDELSKGRDQIHM